VRGSYLAAMSVDVSVRVNGELRRVSGEISISEMLREIGLDPAKVAVERNLEIVPRSSLSDVPVQDGDAFEIVHFVGGG
jgi:thiazole synthase